MYNVLFISCTWYSRGSILLPSTLTLSLPRKLSQNLYRCASNLLIIINTRSLYLCLILAMALHLCLLGNRSRMLGNRSCVINTRSRAFGHSLSCNYSLQLINSYLPVTMTLRTTLKKIIAWLKEKSCSIV